MSFRRLILLFVALGIAGVTVLIGHAYMKPEKLGAGAAAQAALPVTHVLVAQGNLSTGQFVRPENVRWQAWPSDDVPADYVVEGKGSMADFIGSVVRTNMGDGEPVTDARIVRPGDRGFLAAVLIPGDRAVSVPISDTSGIAGFVFPGDHVDVLLTMTVASPDGKAQRHAAETLLTNIRVLAIDQRTDDDAKQAVVGKTATFEVTPKQAETLAVASDIGNISLSLRSLGHGDATDRVAQYSHTWDIDATHVLAPPDTDTTPKQPTPPPAPPPITVTVVRGNAVSQMAFARSGQ